MTIVFTTGEIEYLRNVQELHMQDTCIIQTFSDGSPDSFGQMTPVYTDGSPISCGFHAKTGKELTNAVDPETKTVTTNATIRLPADTIVTARDRIKITHRFGSLLDTPLVFEIAQRTRVGVSGLLVDVIQVETL